MHIYQYFQSLIIIFQQHLSATLVAIIRVSYNNNIITIQIIAQKEMIKPLDVTLDNNM